MKPLLLRAALSRFSRVSPATRISLAVTAALLSLAPASRAVDRIWQVGSGDWFSAGSWTPNGVPDPTSTVSINNGGTAQITQAGAVGQNIFLGTNAGDSGTLSVGGPGTALFTAIAVGNTGSGTLSIQSGGVVTNTTGYVGLNPGGSGNVTVDGTGSHWGNTGDLTLGYSGAATVHIQNGGLLSNVNSTIGLAAGSNANVTIDGVTTKWTNSGTLDIGEAGTGTLNIQHGAVVTNTNGYAGGAPGGHGIVTVDGTGSQWNNSGTLVIANGGAASMSVQNGGVVSNTDGTIGFAAGSNGSVTVDSVGAQWNNSGNLVIANGGLGGLSVQHGGLVTDVNGYVGSATGSNGTVTVDGTVNTSHWTNTGDLFVGHGGTGMLSVQNGGAVSSVNGAIGNLSGSIGTVMVTGAQSTWTNSSNLAVGVAGNGTLNVYNGGVVHAVSGTIGSATGSTGMATVDGANSQWINSAGLTVGDAGNGSLSIQNGGAASNTGAVIGSQASGIGSVGVTGTNSQWTNTDLVNIGELGNGTLTITGGGVVTGTSANIGHGSGSTGLVTVDGALSKWTNTGNLIVGASGGGTLNIQNSGAVSNVGSIIGDTTSGNGAANVDGATTVWTNSSSLTVGNAGTGTLSVTNGGTVNSANGVVGAQAKSSGTATVDGGTWANSAGLTVGQSGSGTLTIRGAGHVSDIIGIAGLGAGSDGTVTVTGTNSVWTNTALTIGSAGSGTLNLLRNGVATVNGGTGIAFLATDAGSVGILNIGNGSSAGTLQASAVQGGAGSAIINFNHNSSNYIFTPTITGTTSVDVQAGTTVFNQAETYTGQTTIDGGRLLVKNSTGSGTGTGAVVVNTSGTLGGNGFIAGPLTLNNGGKIAPSVATPGTAGTTLHAGSLLWNGGGTLSLQLGATSDELVLAGALTKGSPGMFSLSLFNAGITQLNYTLATFASTDFAVTDFTLFLPVGFSATLTETATSLELTLALAQSGPIIQNAGPISTSPLADFTISGPVRTGRPNDNNTINSLIFTPGGTLTISNTLTVTSGRVTTTGGDNSITGGTLFGPNGLHFDITGNLSVGSMLIGNTIKTGAGSLFLDGLLAGNFQVLQGLLGGHGTINGNLYNDAIVSPGHSPGTLSVTRNYTQTSRGLLKIEIAGRDLASHDLLRVGGHAQLDGTLQLVRLDGVKLKRNEAVTFLTADEGVSGKFATVLNDFTSDTILQPTVVYHAESVALAAVQGSFAKLAGLTPNQKSVAQALDSLPDNARTNSLFDYLDYRKLNKLPGDFDKIAPEELTSVFTLGVALANVQSGNIQRRNDDIRGGSGGFSAAGLAVNGTGPSYSGSFGSAGPIGHMSPVGPISSDDGKDVKATKDVVAPAENRWGAFLSGTGEWVSVGNTDNARGYDLTSGGFTLGLDYKVTPNLAIGLAAGYTGSSADLTDRGRAYVNGGKIGLYATFFDYQRVTEPASTSKDAKEVQAPVSYNRAEGLYADVAVFGGYNSYDFRRSALQGEARGDTDGGELNVLFGTGYDFKKGNLTFGPTASFNYTYLGTSDFTEHGSLAPLNIHGGKGESLRTAFGFKASYDWKVGSVLIKPEIRAAWQHEFGDAAYALDADFANGAGDSFRVNGPQLGRDSALLGAGFAVQFNERFSTYFYYDGELGRKDYQSTSVTGGVRLAF